jgi:UDPglucose 6-dehydrogenase
MKNICVIGSGYVGLVTGTCLADLGNEVICVDTDEKKIKGLREGLLPIFEPGLEELVKRNIKDERLVFTTSLKKGIEESEIIFVAVGTPSKPDGSVDLSAVEDVALNIAKYINGYKIIVNKSTVPAGTGAWMEGIIGRTMKSSFEFDIVSNPEFLREGSAIEDFMRPDRIVLGATSQRALEVISSLYEPIYILETPIIKTNVESAEMIKYASNAFLATKISFVNEIANICERVGADIYIVAKGMGLDTRIGGEFLHAGIGYGGSCFPKDTAGIVEIAKKVHYDFKIVKAVMEINEIQKTKLVEKAKKFYGSLEGKTIGILGLSFKPNTDDIREAPSLRIVEMLKKEGAHIKLFDPIAMEEGKRAGIDVEFCKNSYEAATGCDVLMILTEWNAFKELDLLRIKNVMRAPIILDGRNIYDPGKVRELGFKYEGIGRGVVHTK